MSLETTASSAKKDTKSLRVTIPEGIVAYLNIQSGDKLEWKMKTIDGKLTALVRKAKKN
ncbi:MAG: AbrB/MazE/SpoVT family DNA-binding domain-containing protein [Nitrosotalea sp.]